jgi:hypothetical protein
VAKRYCQGHCVSGTERLKLLTHGDLPVETSLPRYSPGGNCAATAPHRIAVSTILIDVEVTGPADSPIVVSGALAQSVTANGGRFSFGHIAGRLNGTVDEDGKFILADPPSVTITSYHSYMSPGGPWCADVKLAEPKLFYLEESRGTDS